MNYTYSTSVHTWSLSNFSLFLCSLGNSLPISVTIICERLIAKSHSHLWLLSRVADFPFNALQTSLLITISFQVGEPKRQHIPKHSPLLSPSQFWHNGSSRCSSQKPVNHPGDSLSIHLYIPLVILCFCLFYLFDILISQPLPHSSPYHFSHDF